jgi:hypothetical protein
VTGDQLRSWAVAQGHNQTTLCKALEINKSRMSRWYNGRNQIPKWFCYALAGWLLEQRVKLAKEGE